MRCLTNNEKQNQSIKIFTVSTPSKEPKESRSVKGVQKFRRRLSVNMLACLVVLSVILE